MISERVKKTIPGSKSSFGERPKSNFQLRSSLGIVGKERKSKKYIGHFGGGWVHIKDFDPL